jgi:hypothetical protein
MTVAETPASNLIEGSINDVRDEESPLLPQPDPDPKLKPLTGVATIIAVLLLGKIMRKREI